MKKSSEETVSSRKFSSMKSNIEVFGWNTKSYEHWGPVGGYEETHTHLAIFQVMSEVLKSSWRAKTIEKIDLRVKSILARQPIYDRA